MHLLEQRLGDDLRGSVGSALKRESLVEFVEESLRYDAIGMVRDDLKFDPFRSGAGRGFREKGVISVIIRGPRHGGAIQMGAGYESIIVGYGSSDRLVRRGRDDVSLSRKNEGSGKEGEAGQEEDS